MSTKTNPNWIECLSLPFTKIVPQVFAVDCDDFIVTSTGRHGLWKFNARENKWTKVFHFDTRMSGFAAAYDHQHKLMHILQRGFFPAVITLDLQTKNKVEYPQDAFYSGLFVSDNKVHKICSSDGLCNYGLIHLKCKKTILKLGGCRNLSSGFNIHGRSTPKIAHSENIYRFSRLDSNWKELDIKMPVRGMSSYGIVATTNEQHIIILGGRIWSGDESRDIFIYDTLNNVFIKSKVKCPTQGDYAAVLTNNSHRDDTTCLGFVKDCYKAENFMGVESLPHDLIRMIGFYFCNEQIHLLEEYARSPARKTKHWKINVDDIFQAL
eukprot:126480_1